MVHFGEKKIDGLKQESVKLNQTTSNWAKFNIKVESVNASLTNREIKNIVDGVNYVYEFFDRVLYFDIYKTVPVNILILSDKNEYVRYLKENDQEKLIASYGVYLHKKNQIVVYIRKEREKTFKTIRHEVSHAIVGTIMPYAPAWLNEGIAEQMETINRSVSGLYIESHTLNRRSVDRALRDNGLINISEFLKLPSTQWRHSLGDSRMELQAHTGQFVYFLLSTSPNRDFVIRLMHKYSLGDRTLSYYLVDANYIGGLRALEITWSSWVKNQSRNVINFF